MLAADQLHVAHETFRERRVIQRRQKNQQRAAAQAQPDERAKLVEIRRHDFRLQGVKRVAAGAVMRLAVFRADEFFHLVGERQQPEQIALLLRRQAEHERGGYETFQHGSLGCANCRRVNDLELELRTSRALNREASTMT